MTRPILASGLLLTAERLAGANAGAGRPALADLRRATSTAYYALFHQVVTHASKDFLPDGTDSEIADVARWFTHTGVYSAAGVVLAGARTAQPRRDLVTPVQSLRSACGGTVSHDLLVVADAFKSLQDARHDADYNGNYDPSRAVTLAHVQEASLAVRKTWALWSARTSPRKNRQALHAGHATFLRLSLLYSGGPKAR